jgi:ferritin
MLSKNMQDLMNQQIKDELYSAYLYLSMAAHCQDANLPGCAHWMRKQAAEEQSHAMKFFDHVFERGGKVELEAIEKPPVSWTSALNVFEEVLAHEVKVTALIHGLYEAAVKEKDYASQVMLQWFVNEQVEEEANATEIVVQMKAVGSHVHALFMLDHRLGQR